MFGDEMISDYKPVTVNAANHPLNSYMDIKNKVVSDDVILNNILNYSKQKTFINGESSLTELKSILTPHYGIDNISDQHLLSIILNKFNVILNNKNYEVNKTIDSILINLLKPSVFDPIEGNATPYITRNILINAILIEIALSRVDWLDYSKT